MFEQIIGVNLRAPLFLSKALAPHMPDGSAMVFFSSGLTRANAAPADGLVYTASKVRTREKGLADTGRAPSSRSVATRTPRRTDFSRSSATSARASAPRASA